jgi:alkanesulfonate monooxygenase SsuD/methylene tetrahydromethanopterin reductase-like flavin-dependent oxidoreductase (luciferase family)
MRFGFSPIQSQPRFDAMLRQAALAEELGFDALWAHEHHSQGMMYPSPLMALAAMAPATKRIALGTNMLLLPLYSALRVAEEAAMVDVLSGGRLRLGVSAGYSPSDLEAFGVPQNERGMRLREGVRLIREVWTRDHVDLSGRFSTLKDFTLFPKPIQRPAPPIYVGATIDAAVRRAARLGDELLISTTQASGDIPRMLGVYHDELRKLGRDPASKRTALNRIVFVVADRAAKERATSFFRRCFLGLYDTWGHENVTGLEGDSRSPAALGADHFIIGEPAECVELIERYRALGIAEIACLMNFGGPDLDQVERSMRLFAQRVRPHFAAPKQGE